MKPKYKKKNFFKRGQLKSKLEMRIDDQLKAKKANYTYETEKLQYVVHKHYVPDFIVIKPSGYKVYIEVKGYFRSEDRSKMLAVKQNNPSLDIRMLFDNDNKLNKNSKSRYSDWCEKHGFLYAFKKIPKGWTA